MKHPQLSHSVIQIFPLQSQAFTFTVRQTLVKARESCSMSMQRRDERTELISGPYSPSARIPSLTSWPRSKPGEPISTFTQRPILPARSSGFLICPAAAKAFPRRRRHRRLRAEPQRPKTPRAFSTNAHSERLRRSFNKCNSKASTRS